MVRQLCPRPQRRRARHLPRQVAVRPELRRQGVGGALIGSCLDASRHTSVYADAAPGILGLNTRLVSCPGPPTSRPVHGGRRRLNRADRSRRLRRRHQPPPCLKRPFRAAPRLCSPVRREHPACLRVLGLSPRAEDPRPEASISDQKQAVRRPPSVRGTVRRPSLIRPLKCPTKGKGGQERSFTSFTDHCTLEECPSGAPLPAWRASLAALPQSTAGLRPRIFGLRCLPNRPRESLEP